MVSKRVNYLDGVRVAVAVLAVRRAERHSSLDRLRLTREVAQVDLRVGEQVLATASRHVLDPVTNAYATN